MQRFIIKSSFILCAFLTLVLAGCASNIASNSYSANSINQAQKAQYGSIVQARPVQVTSNNAETGTMIGAGTGAVAGSAIGGDVRTNIIAGIGGAVIGGIAGNQIGKHTGNQSATQYVVKLENGSMISVIQGGPQTYQVGQRVIVTSGGNAPARIMPA